MNSKNIVIALTVVCSAFAGLGEPQKTDRQKMLAEQRARIYRASGGEVVKPGKGHVAVVAGAKPVADALSPAVRALAKQTGLDIRLVEDAGAAKDAGLTVRFIDDPAKPPMLAAPEAGWSEVNVAALGTDLATESAKEKFLDSRIRKMFLRAFAYAAGAGGSSFPENLLDIVTVRDLDHREEFLPVDALDMAMSHVNKRGIAPGKLTTYRKAAYEGWAPKPTNDVQRAIWEKVHAPPKTPLKIQFDPATQKGKVTK